MSNYIIGGWSQNPGDQPPSQFAITMYGMITNLQGLTSGTPAAPGWSPAHTSKPSVAAGSVLWTYGGGGAVPDEMPANSDDINAILSATKSMGWDGIDVDDESDMDISNVIATMKGLKEQGKQSSYTFLAGWDYNNPNASPLGQTINNKVQRVAESGVCDRYCLMCYASAMWSMSDIVANVGPAIERTIEHVGDPKKVILALTPAGLNAENLKFFLEQVTINEIGGLFIWNFPALNSDDFNTICSSLEI